MIIKNTITSFLIVIAISLSVNANAQYIKLLDFNSVANGKWPHGELVSDGTFLYGMAYGGGISNNGTLFKIKPDGTGFVKLIDFNGTANGSSPTGTLIFDNGFLYGMTFLGGTNNLGTIFKIMTDGSGFVKLQDFNGTANGSRPQGSLVSDGTFLYGMTSNGGSSDSGTVFKIMRDGSGYLKLLDFNGITNGGYPYGSLFLDGDSLYGMTNQGGANNLGTIFKINADGTNYIKLLNFNSTVTGNKPVGSLIFDGAFLYGMNYFGGNGVGTVFKIKKDGTDFSSLLSFYGNSYGAFPNGTLLYDGNFLYGMVSQGPNSSSGNIFKILPDGTGYTKLLDFNGASNGATPYGSLILEGNFVYGMTNYGGTNDLGTIFKLDISPVGSKELDNASSILYPNPTNNVFTIQLQNPAQIIITNTLGQIILNEIMSAGKQEVNLNRYEHGIYFVNVIQQNKNNFFKLIKE